MTLAGAAALTAATAAAGSTPPGRLAKGTTASGRPVIASASATIRRPTALYGRAIGRVDNATFIVSCKRDARPARSTSIASAPGRGASR